MSSRFLDPDHARRLAEHRYDFGRKSLGGRVVLVPGGVGGLGAAITAMLQQEGALPVVAYRSNRGRALAFQQKLQDAYGAPITLVEADVATAASKCLGRPGTSRARSAAWWRDRQSAGSSLGTSAARPARFLHGN
jgi:NAD(P)-dependent dehydrogenase (short-subunit alcohol dehydrogenase family)